MKVDSDVANEWHTRLSLEVVVNPRCIVSQLLLLDGGGREVILSRDPEVIQRLPKISLVHNTRKVLLCVGGAACDPHWNRLEFYSV